jgi:hypothetical protein
MEVERTTGIPQRPGNSLSTGGIEDEHTHSSREVHIYTAPPGVDVGWKTIGLLELTTDEELAAGRRASATKDAVRAYYERIKQALVEVDGRAIRVDDGSARLTWNTMRPKGRDLVMFAYNDLHTNKKDVAADFLKSHSSKIG